MVDFLIISTRSTKRGTIEIYPKFRLYPKSSDLMIRGGDFYAIWLEDKGIWSTDEQDALRLIDYELDKYAEENRHSFDGNVRVLHMWDSESGMIDSWHKYCQKQLRDSYQMLDEKLIFSNTETTKTDYASKRLSYPLERGDISAFDRLMSTLYAPEERHKIEWAIGSIVSGDSKKLQKFMVLYGEAGAGKSTILNIIQWLFDGYYSVFDAKALGSASNQFALEAFRKNPLVAIQHDGDLSRIEDNTRINSVVSHEEMMVNEKYTKGYNNSFKCFLFMGTNKPVKITDAKSGLIRRLIDVTPSGNKLSFSEYRTIMKRIKFELGAIAHHCLDLYLSDPNYYDEYIPANMLGATNDFYNFIIDSYHVFKKEDGTTLKAAWEMYKTYCEEANIPYPLSQRSFKEELKNYFREFNDRANLEDGSRARSYYNGFRTEKFDTRDTRKPEKSKHKLISFEAIPSIFDKEYASCSAQYATSKGTPTQKWDENTTQLSDIDTSKLHYVKVPKNHIVIDFDIPDENGNKCFEKNLEAASKWPATYAELSKSGAGIHLHYIYTGDVSKLSRLYEEHIEIKTSKGNSSLRRKLTKCNDLPVATISSGLPLKGEDKMINFDGVKNEKMLRSMIRKNLDKEYHGATKPSIDYINALLDEAYSKGIGYDVSDLRNEIFAFAANSTNQAEYCIKLVNKMKFKSDDPSDSIGGDEAPIVFYDIEVFPNLFLVNWKFQGEGKPVVRMINPSSTDIEGLLKYRLVGFNCRRYDNHILYARLMGYDNLQLHKLSQKIINGDKNAFFGEAYNISYTDVYDFAAKKQSLKKWEIELNIHHQELGLGWDEDVPESLWEKVAEYCDNDVIATEAVFDHLKGDFVARQILAELAGMTVNDTTNSLTTRIVFGKERKPVLVYTDLATGERTDGSRNPKIINAFPGYEYKDGKNIYRDTDIGFGGYIISTPGVYTNVALLDIKSLHPNSIRAMNCFGRYTKNFTDILDARVAIKEKRLDDAREMLDGRLAPYLDDPSKAKDLAQALKIAINSVYGLTAANFDNPFRDVRNKNNIVALRGALFMRTLQDEVESRGFRIVAIKTDSIKIADATKDIIDFCFEFAAKYGYEFDHEATYDRMCQINDADYIAKYKDSTWCETVYGYIPGNNKESGGEWTATGKQFAIPYVYKTLFSKEPIEFADLCETKEVKTAIYLNRNEGLGEEENDYRFVGKVGSFCPIKDGCGGGLLCREAIDKEGNVKYNAVTGSKGFRWLEAEYVKELGKQDDIDMLYFNKLVDNAVDSISKYGDFEWFVSDESEEVPTKDLDLPWFMACGTRETCEGCPSLKSNLKCGLGLDNSDFICTITEK